MNLTLTITGSCCDLALHPVNAEGAARVCMHGEDLYKTNSIEWWRANSNNTCGMRLTADARIEAALDGAPVAFDASAIATSAALLTHVFTRTPLLDCIGRGTGLDDAGLARKRELLGHTITRANLPLDADAVTVLAEFGGFEIAMMTGAYLSAAQERMLILVDGVIATSALLVAHAMYPEILDYCIFSHCSAEPAHRAQLPPGRRRLVRNRLQEGRRQEAQPRRGRQRQA